MRIAVSGAVQGVGFRPFVHREATALGLAGFVSNSPQGVTIEVEGPALAIEALLDRLEASPPPNARIGAMAAEAIWTRGDVDFEIRASTEAGAPSADVLPDLATCDECRAEIGDPRARRYRYPFTNCTQCGPRFSIIRSLPYDRARTTMAGFPMCADCRTEYENPADRRFHAEPIACAACGPQLALWDEHAAVLATRDDALRTAAAALREGRIVAVKGLGGFHLMVDARDPAAVARLRERKRREAKPFAVMFARLAAIEAAAEVAPAEAALLTGRERPIVLVRKRGEALAVPVAPDSPLLGAMLPYTPLHHLLLGETGFPLVATSGNRSEEPIVTDEAEAPGRLRGIADLFLVHDRPIVRPLDDSVARIVAGRSTVLRRARGYAPATVAPCLRPDILAVGGHLKATIALGTAAGTVLSQHIGDLDSAEAREAYGRAIDDLCALYDGKPRLIARDLHPDYHSSRVADGFAVPVVPVQHHVAHVASCMAEHGLEPPVLGVAFDGTGYGPDGTVWGGEFLLITDAGWRRVAHLKPFRLPGGEAAAREPRRSAIGLLHAAFGAEAFAMTDLAPVASFTAAERSTLAAMLDRGVNAPLTTSAGRLFDAVAALAGLRQRASYEGQAAMELESAADEAQPHHSAYPFAIIESDDAPMEVDWEPALRATLADLRAGVRTGDISAAFHAGLANAIAVVAGKIGEPVVVLTGGCFQNARLAEAAIAALRTGGLTPVWHERVPPNDGGLALGQLWWAARYGGGG
ncbi:carbamoyltransferase HypF [soil metagenome]